MTSIAGFHKRRIQGGRNIARTPENENITRGREFATANQADQAFGAASQDINQFNKNEQTLARGGEVGANPYLSPEYLSNVNKLEANSLNSATSAGKTALLDQNRRAGGGNTGATTGAIQGLTLQRARLANNLSANRAAEDYGKNLSWQQYLAGEPLKAASAETSLYGPALSANSSLNADLTKYGIEQMQEKNAWQQKLVKAAELAGAAGLTAATGGAAAPVLIGGLAGAAKG